MRNINFESCTKKGRVTVILTLFSLFSLDLVSQSTWFKYIPGWEAKKSYLINDTIVSFGAGDFSLFDYFLVKNTTDKAGKLIKSDTLDYKKIIGDTLVTSIFISQKINPLDFSETFFVPVTVTEKVGSEYKYRSYLFNVSDLGKHSLDLNHDTFASIILASKAISGSKYIILEDRIPYSSKNIIASHYLYRITEIGKRLIQSQLNNAGSIYGHIPYFEDIYEDNQDSSNLFLQILDRWDFHDVPAKFEAIIRKIDTSGKLIWECRPSGVQDTINTSGFNMVQLPNGNILCSWLDFYYRPWKKPGYPYQFEDNNPNATIWFAEIDYQTGKRLWVKNIQQYLSWKMTPSDINGRTDINDLQITDALIIEKNYVVWCGFRSGTQKLTNSWKYYPVLIKTDLHGNPISYREFNLFQSDTTDKGFKPYDIIQTPDKGYLLTGEYMRRWGTPMNGGVFQTGALLKLDSNGCYLSDCNRFDNIVKIRVSETICKVFPNPVNHSIEIDYPDDSNDWVLEILDLNGKELFASLETVRLIPTNQWPYGLYIITLTNKTSGHHETHKIIIEH